MTTQVFISYRRMGDDERLARALSAHLATQGCAMFIDTDLEPGADWSLAIRNGIDAADYFIVLLSEESIASEMVQGEVRQAHRKRKRDQRPLIVPIRVKYGGPLDYEIDSYLGRLQYATWHNDADTPRVLERISKVVARGLPVTPPPPSTDPEPLSLPATRPLPKADPRFVAQGGGALRADDPFYVQRESDGRAEDLAELRGQTLVIKGPRQRGKSSLLVRYMKACTAKQKQVIYFDFQLFTEAELKDLAKLLSSLAAIFLDELGLPPITNNVSTPANMVTFLQRDVLPRVNRDLVFAFDEVDRIMGKPYQTDFFALLRAWHNRRASNLEWEKLGLALVISTETHLLIKNADQSPFNVAVKLELDELTLEQCADLNSRYPNPLADTDLDDIFELLGGHPFLTRLAFHRLAARQFELQDLQERAAAPHGPFGDHLRALHARLSEDPALLQCLRQVIRYGTGNQAEIDRLSSAGIVKQEDGRYRPANLLYARFFGNAR